MCFYIKKITYRLNLNRRVYKKNVELYVLTQRSGRTFDGILNTKYYNH